jgi:hypothetical protein
MGGVIMAMHYLKGPYIWDEDNGIWAITSQPNGVWDDGPNQYDGFVHTLDEYDSWDEAHKAAMVRMVNCVNLLAGIPDEELPNVLKAYVEVKLMNAFEREEGEIVEHSDLIIARGHGNIAKYPALALLENLKHVGEK